MTELPDFLKQGEAARLFPVLADTSRENRSASILLALLTQVPALAAGLLGTANCRVGKRTKVEAFTEIVTKQFDHVDKRPDGLIVASTGKSRWSALVEAKIGKSDLNSDQVSKYLEVARANGIDAVITISNQFVARADHSPVSVPKNLLRKTSLYHWSWMGIRTQCEIIAHQKAVDDPEQFYLLSEFLRFLRHPGTGVESFTQMGPRWKELVQSVSNHGHLKKSDPDVEEEVGGWFEEERDLCLQLSRHVGQSVQTIIERKLVSDPVSRLKDGIGRLVETQTLTSAFRVPDCASDLELCADLPRKTVAIGMKLKAPLDRKSTKARVNWLLRMLPVDDERLQIRAHWPGRTLPSLQPLSRLRDDPLAIQTDNPDATPHGFEVLLIEGLGKRFSGRRTFVEDLERIVPEFYDLVAQHLRAWQAPPPRPVTKKAGESEVEQGEPDVAGLEPKNAHAAP